MFKYKLGETVETVDGKGKIIERIESADGLFYSVKTASNVKKVAESEFDEVEEVEMKLVEVEPEEPTEMQAPTQEPEKVKVVKEMDKPKSGLDMMKSDEV